MRRVPIAFLLSAMSSLRIPASSACTPRPFLARAVSSSPYGRTHVWMTRKPKIPNPVVPTFVQRVTRADGSTFLHRTTSPRTSIRLTRDVTSNPLYNNGVSKGGLFGADQDAAEDEAAVEDETSGMSRFTKRFDDLGRDSLAWLNQLHKANATERAPVKGTVVSAAEAAGGGSDKKKRK